MKTDSRDYVSRASQVLLAVVAALGRRPLEPQTVVSLSSRTGNSRDRVFRALRNLEAAEWAEQLPGGWRLSPEIVRISERYRLALADTHRRYLGGE
ncbi:MAG: hypothetical protein F4Z19_01680 [Holophagales bacterium]|nr:hypothetical protein [Holophagales bacterium]